MEVDPRNYQRLDLFNDPTADGLINRRYVRRMIEILTLTDLNEDEHKQFINIMLLVAKKLVAVWNHFQRYTDVQKQLVEECKKSKPVNEQEVISYSQDLFLEFDEFLVQVKSALDYLMRIPLPIMGKAWTIRLFGKRGKMVIAALKNNVPDEWKERTNWLADTLVAVHLPWLEATINARDMINHCLDGGFRFEAFIVCKIKKGGDEYIHIPQMQDDFTIHNIIEITWINLLSVVEDFTAGILALRLRAGYVLQRNRPTAYSIESPWNALRKEDFERWKQDNRGVKKFRND
jgi:hypothetical protein